MKGMRRTKCPLGGENTTRGSDVIDNQAFHSRSPSSATFREAV